MSDIIDMPADQPGTALAIIPGAGPIIVESARAP
jgi:hypothetical protein